ncbi:HigA family addiction module antitoxin [Thalassotalea agarivorans]|uniref:Addiction module antidote protein, HigA family n=1 Tax=Thalassotalea agarivorans TaxID=349064 RepID=A0A1I0FL95_THASX|nr:HigA family addiction module antitoxin [Thalassotalea agarivorans]SET58874.1 addiction module antidote protein, HigA family [Thalassotalea agarivorans]
MTIPSFVTQSQQVSRPEDLPRPHPGDVFKRRFIEKTSLKRPEIAAVLGVSEKHLSRFVNGHIRVEVAFARKLEACTNVSANAWLHYQIQYDLYKTAKLDKQQTLLSA